MNETINCRSDILRALNRTVADAVDFFMQVDETIFNGYQTARQVLSHLVFWHREYVMIIQAISCGHQPALRQGSFADLNVAANQEFGHLPLPVLAKELADLQFALDTVLRSLSNWEASFPVKRGVRSKSIRERLPMIESHIRHHVDRLKRAIRHGEDWIKAYYEEVDHEPSNP
jgi:hypothetical protein